LALKTELGGYVKFLRGTPAAWDRLEVKDPDTLYFIAKSGENKGKLYLGTKLIADGENITKMEDLENVFIDEGLPSNSVLVYDSDNNSWVSKTVNDIFSLVVSVMTGATETENGSMGLVPKPLAGQHNLFLRGDATWANPTAAVEIELGKLDKKVDDATADFIQKMADLRGGYPETSTIPQIASQIVSVEIAKIVASAPEQFDTLKEIADWLQAHDNVSTVTNLNNRVNKIELSVFGPDGTTGLVKDVAQLNKDLYGDGTNEGIKDNVITLMSKVPGMEASLASINTKIQNMSGDIVTIKDMLKWQDLILTDDI
jgi:hypothetical protein